MEEDGVTSHASHPIDLPLSFFFLPPLLSALAVRANVGFARINKVDDMVGVTVPAAIVACRAILPHRQRTGAPRARPGPHRPAALSSLQGVAPHQTAV